jgi:hypothetical protein
MFSLQQNWRKGQNRFCLEARGVGGRNDRNNLCTYEYMHKERKERNVGRMWGKRNPQTLLVEI